MVSLPMACSAHCDEVHFGVISQATAKFLVVNFQVQHRTARLTTPAIATQHMLPEPLIGRSIESQAREFWPN